MLRLRRLLCLLFWVREVSQAVEESEARADWFAPSFLISSLQLFGWLFHRTGELLRTSHEKSDLSFHKQAHSIAAPCHAIQKYFKITKSIRPAKKKTVGIRSSPEVMDHFKGLAEETGLAYQKLIDLYLLDCAKNRKKLMMK
jgi:predicted DNA binding CopG/RHH family protein